MVLTAFTYWFFQGFNGEIEVAVLNFGGDIELERVYEIVVVLYVVAFAEMLLCFCSSFWTRGPYPTRDHKPYLR